jgi:hypothetical protein
MQSMHVLIGRMRRLNFLLLGGGSSLLPRDVVAQQSLPVVGFLFIGNPERSSYWTLEQGCARSTPLSRVARRPPCRDARSSSSWRSVKRKRSTQTGRSEMHVITTRWNWNRWVAAGLLGALGWSNAASADAVTDWHEIAMNTLCSGPATPPRSGPVGLLDMAIVQAAVYDAVQAIGGKYKPYHVTIPGASGSPEAAAAKAAHDVLVAFYAPKAEELGKTYKEYLAKKGLKEDDPGVAVGQKAAAGIITARANDGRVPNPAPPPWMGENAVGKWRPVDSTRAPASAGMAAPWLGEVKPFVIQSGSQIKPNKSMPSLTSEEYTKDYNEVKAVGAKTNSTRTPEQTEMSNFFSTDSPALCLAFQGAIREPVAAHVKDINESSRAIALASLSVADAVITVWWTKRNDHNWRPITAIREGENDGNPATAGDPAWESYLATPPYSDWTSGANGLSGAITRSHTNFFGKDDVTFTIKATPDQKPRTYNKLSDFARDIENVRVYQGIHFRFAEVAGREQGEKVADEVFKNVATPK